MAVKIRLKRFGKVRAPHYRVVVMNSRTKRDGRAIEEIGKYHPTDEPSLIEINSERAQYWLSVGAQPSPQVTQLLRLTGDWQKFKGIKNPEARVKTKDGADSSATAEAIAAVDTDAEKKKAEATSKAEAAQAEQAAADEPADTPADDAAEAPADETAEAPADEAAEAAAKDS